MVLEPFLFGGKSRRQSRERVFEQLCTGKRRSFLRSTIAKMDLPRTARTTFTFVLHSKMSLRQCNSRHFWVNGVWTPLCFCCKAKLRWRKRFSVQPGFRSGGSCSFTPTHMKRILLCSNLQICSPQPRLSTVLSIFDLKNSTFSGWRTSKCFSATTLERTPCISKARLGSKISVRKCIIASPEVGASIRTSMACTLWTGCRDLRYVPALNPLRTARKLSASRKGRESSLLLISALRISQTR
mmetsp:Transcript_22723/g.53876  ORF Transcript_22723/g.53876 Transcript_22723/m.53876 type:complete len:241 (+) Transcript_22723:339-1061(+)